MRRGNLFLLLTGLAMALWVARGHGQVNTTGKVAVANCANCHGWRKPVTERRILVAPHDGVTLAHGQGAGLWCLDCHHLQNPATLKGREGQAFPFAQAQENCAVCHNRQTRDWRAGVHGKRVASWQGERTVQRCAVCHDPHAPRFAGIVPSSPPSPPRGMP